MWQAGFVEHKALLCRDLIKNCKRLHNELYKKRKQEREKEKVKSEGNMESREMASITMGEVPVGSVTRDQIAMRSSYDGADTFQQVLLCHPTFADSNRHSNNL